MCNLSYHTALMYNILLQTLICFILLIKTKLDPPNNVCLFHRTDNTTIGCASLAQLFKIKFD